ncbi:hypothetical protein [Alkalilacustris brevis]|uniref:hypothetical protein n=1 Tax=Alkalilacustris brevis TaxID=2026338 RepID=UPI000E0CD54A|nr:hypothetical protein [Alkalilacustris brevis]
MPALTLRPAHAIVLAAIMLLAALLWPGPGGDIAFWAFQVVLVAVLLAAGEFRKSYAIPRADGGWTMRERLHLGLVQGAFFMALMLVVGAEGARETPASWLISALMGGAFFALIAAVTGVFGPTGDTDRIAEYDRSSNRMDNPGDRLRLYAMPVVMLGIAPILVLPGGLLAPALGLPVYLLLAVAVAEPAPLYPRRPEAEEQALWNHQWHLVLRMAAVILLAVVIWQRL